MCRSASAVPGVGGQMRKEGIDQNLMRPAEVNTLLADSSKAKKILKWKPEVSFDDLVKGMVESDLEFVTNHGH